MSPNFQEWAAKIAGVSAGDDQQPPDFRGINLPLNRARLARFLVEFVDDRDVADLLMLDVVAAAAGLPITSTGQRESLPSLALRPFRLWEYAWLYRILGLSAGGKRVLDLGGPATHLSLLSALAGCHVTSVDINPEFVAAARKCAQALQLDSLGSQIGDMRDLSGFSNDSFDVVVSCSVLEHLTGDDQQIALREMARVLKPGGLIGLTFDFGLSAAGANVYLPPPHDPPQTAAEALRRFVQAGLVPVGNPFNEDPEPGSLFLHQSIRYTVASLFLAKPPAPRIPFPAPKLSGNSVLGHLKLPGLAFRFHNATSQIERLLEQGEANRIAAEERLLELRDKETMLKAIEHSAQERAVELEKAVGAIADRDRRISTLVEEHRAEMQQLHLQFRQAFDRANMLEQAAQERLQSLHEKDSVMKELHCRLREAFDRADSLEKAAAQRLAVVDNDAVIISELRGQLQQNVNRAKSLEASATERLDALHEKDSALQALRSQLQDALLRADSLEQVAAERLEALVTNDAALREAIEELQRAMGRISQSERLAAERLSALEAAKAALEKTHSELRNTSSQLKELNHRFETEGLRAYLYRRLNRRGSGPTGSIVLK